MCYARSPACTNLPYRAFLGWFVGPYVSQTRYLGQRCCLPCCRYMQISPKDRTMSVLYSADSCEEDYLGSDGSSSDESSPSSAGSDDGLYVEGHVS